MDQFFTEDDHFQATDMQNILSNDQIIQNEPQNLFGLKFKENMFSQPSMDLVDLTMDDQFQDEKLKEQQYSCSDQTMTSPLKVERVQFPPCRCHKIKCQKKYCECFRNGRKCTKKCICIDCCNSPIIIKMKVNVEQLWQVSYMFKRI